MEVFKEPLQFMTHDQLVEKYWDHRVLLLDPEINEKGHIKGGYLKAVSFCNDPQIRQLSKQFPDRKAAIIDYSYLVYKALGIFPFGNA